MKVCGQPESMWVRVPYAEPLQLEPGGQQHSLPLQLVLCMLYMTATLLR
jgi:hypothetical protein